jgi:hypothetical protein
MRIDGEHGTKINTIAIVMKNKAIQQHCEGVM